MTTTQMPAPVCATCLTVPRPGAHFCARCGMPLAAWPPRPVPPIPGPRTGYPDPRFSTAPPAVAPLPAPAAPRRGVTAALVSVAVVLALVAGGLGAVLVFDPFGSAGVASPAGVPAAAPAEAPAGGPWATVPQAVAPDPATELEALRARDAGTVSSLAGSWVPQLSSKRIGDVAEGRTWDAAAVLAEHQELRAQYPDARLLWSGDYASFSDGDFWVTVVGSPSTTGEGANAWCDSAGLDADHCYAKRLTVTGGPEGNSLMRG